MLHPLKLTRPLSTLIFVAVILPMFDSAYAQQIDADPLKLSADRDSLEAQRTLDELSHATYSDRQAATIKMWKDRELSREIVQEAARNPDPEISGRARWILRQWRRGAMPDTPPEISRLLQAGDQPSVVMRLLEAGQFAAAVVAVEESAGTIDRESIQRRINAALARRFPIYVHAAIGSESMDDLLRLVDLVANSNETAACRFELMQLLGVPITDDQLLPRSATSWTQSERDSATVMLLVKSQRYDDAIKAAEASGDQELLLKCLMVASRWREIADSRRDLAEQSDLGTMEHCVYWCQTMMAADRCGDTDLFDNAMKQLTAPEVCSQPTAINLRWRYFASHGRIDEALAVLATLSADAAASVALDSSRTRYAFEVLGFPIDRIDSDYLTWINDAIAAQQSGSQAELGPEIRTLLVVMQCLLSIGRDDVAWSIAKRLCDSDLRIDSNRKIRVAEYVLSTLTMTKRTDWIAQLAIDPKERTLSQDSLEIAGQTLPDADGTTVEIVMDTLSKMDPQSTPEQRFADAWDLLDGRVPDGFDEAVDFDRFYEIVTQPRAVRSIRIGEQQGVTVQANLNIVTMLSRLGQTELAASCLAKLAQSGDTEAVFRMAEQALESGRADTATKLFEMVYRTIELQGRLGGADDVTLAGKALIGIWTIARRQGDEERSQELLSEIRLMLCSPSSHTRSTLAGYLADRDETQLAIEAYERLLPIKVFSQVDADDLYSVARGYALTARDSAPDEAARWFDFSVARSIASDDFRPGAFVTLPMYVRRWSLEKAIANGDSVAAAKHIDRLLELDPLDIDLAERLLPKMRAASMQDLANQTFEVLFEKGIAYTESFSLDAMTCNNLAWVAAMNGRRLEDARRLSEMAVRVEPDSAIYRDTLAEILFRLGERESALNIEKACLIDDPGQWHLHQQIERFSISE